ncbi:hypothetical protein DM02DRAFT_697304 [Periconia macrospinosa]|uniref:Cupin type-1 domain-containing protein n=1 Tax=Periconia macrospinosa TaxID=97972 RepID=A0A2V1DZ61_9PLEO|nr:hypothetical protein DM02DRAFT_697304 [Periconia macrospinosa]
MPSILSKAFVASLAFAAAQAIPTVRRADSIGDNTALLEKLITTPTEIKRQQKLWTKDGKELLDPESLVKATTFDFSLEQPGATTAGGAPTADVETFPILLGSGVTFNHVTLGACGIFLPHVHPRAHEFFVVVDGGEVEVTFTPEMGLLGGAGASPEITATLKKDAGIVFPQGAIHYQINNSSDCKPSNIYAVLTSENAGTTLVLQDPTLGNATITKRQVGVEDFASVRAVLPARAVSVVEQCIKRCNLS